MTTGAATGPPEAAAAAMGAVPAVASAARNVRLNPASGFVVLGVASSLMGQS